MLVYTVSQCLFHWMLGINGLKAGAPLESVSHLILCLPSIKIPAIGRKNQHNNNDPSTNLTLAISSQAVS